MKWFRRKKEEVSVPEPSRCFREKVDAFWTWWSCHSERILVSVNENGGRAIQPEISDQVSWLCPDLAWVFGPAPDGNGHSFTLSSEGDATQRFLIGYWLERAPQLPGWTFYPCRQPSTELEGAKIAIGKIEVEAKSLWISSSIDVEREKIDITAWSPHFGDIKEEQAWRILYLFLDAALGEDRTERCLGSIDLGDDRLSHSFPLTELRLHVEHVFAEHGWDLDGMPWATYSIEEPLGDFPRGDIFVGSTQSMRLLNEFAREEGPIEDPLLGSGAELVFLQFPVSIFPKGSEVEFRSEIIDALTEHFDVIGSGIVLGGAMGRQFAYIDLLLFDGEAAREVIASVLRDRNLVDQCGEFSFVK